MLFSVLRRVSFVRFLYLMRFPLCKLPLSFLALNDKIVSNTEIESYLVLPDSCSLCNRHNTQTSLGMHEGAAAPSSEIRSGDMRGARNRSPPPPVADEGGRSVGNRRERFGRDHASSPEGGTPLPISFGVCPKGAREMMFSRYLNRCKDAKQTCSETSQSSICSHRLLR